MKKILSILIAIMLMTVSQSVFAYTFNAVSPSGHMLYYNIVAGHAEVVRPGTGSSFDNYITGDLVIPDSVTYNGNVYAVTVLATIATIGGSYGPFYNCSGLTSVTIPNTVTRIGNSAFSNCSGLNSVTIPNSVTSILGNAFNGVRHIEYYGSATGAPWGAYSINGITDGDFVFSNVNRDTLIAYIGAGGAIVIPSSVTSIGNFAFRDCSSLTSVTIPTSVTSIGNSAFSGCSGLNSITIPNSVTSIGDNAFDGCIGLTSVTIPDSVTSIGFCAFRNCSGLTSVTFNAINCTTMGIGGEYYSVFKDCTNFTSLTIGNSVTNIPNYAFEYCSGLTSVTIPNSVTSIGRGAFWNCISLTSVTIPNSVTSIGSEAFYNCSGLTSVTITNNDKVTLFIKRNYQIFSKTNI